jgi:AAHS family 4-hydroxybenzoate transporter-like MFS transporter
MGTLLLWLCCFMSMLIYYMGVNWMPLLLKEAGLSLQQFSVISALFPIGGGVGSILVGWLMGRHEANKVLAGTYLAAGVLAWVVGNSVGRANKAGCWAAWCFSWALPLAAGSRRCHPWRPVFIPRIAVPPVWAACWALAVSVPSAGCCWERSCYASRWHRA